MSWSLGEISDLAIKAARGGGKPWGLAEEAGWAVRWLAERGLPGPEALAGLLISSPGVCPVTLGASIGDFGSHDLLSEAGVIAEPLLILPFLSRLAPQGGALEVAVGDVTVIVWTNGLLMTDQLAHEAQVAVAQTVPQPPTPLRRVRIEEVLPEAFAILQNLASKTYAPATEASRAKGAGAGLTDND